MPKTIRECGLKGCDNKFINPIIVGFKNSQNKDLEVVVCEYHARMITGSPRGSFRITDDYELKPIPANPLIIT